MVRAELRRQEIDWENTNIHISKEELEREQAHEEAIKQTKQYLNRNFPRFYTVNNVYYETEVFNDEAGMYEVLHVDHILIGDQAMYVIKTVNFPENAELYGSSTAKTWHYTMNQDEKETCSRRVSNADRENQRCREYMQQLAEETAGVEIPTIGIVNVTGLTEEAMHMNLDLGHHVVPITDLADKIRHYEKTIDNERVVYDNSDRLVRKFKEEEVYDNIVPQIRDVELKHRIYMKLSQTHG